MEATAPNSGHPRPRDPDSLSPIRRAVLIVVGGAALALGVIGIFLPVLPTTPFLLVAAACFARASTRLYAWLLGQPSLGPIITTWRRSRALPPGMKTRALIVVAVTFAISFVLVDAMVIRVVLVAVAVILAAFLYRLPTAVEQAADVDATAARPSEQPR